MGKGNERTSLAELFPIKKFIKPGVAVDDSGYLWYMWSISPLIWAGENTYRTFRALFQAEGIFGEGAVFQCVFFFTDAIYHLLHHWMLPKSFKRMWIGRMEHFMRATRQPLPGFGSVVRNGYCIFAFSPPIKAGTDNQRIKDMVRQVEGTLKAANLNPQPVDPKVLAYILFCIFNPGEPQQKGIIRITEEGGGNSEEFSKSFLLPSQIEVTPERFVISQKGKQRSFFTLTLKEPPPEVSIQDPNFFLGDFFSAYKQVPCPFFISTTITIIGRKKNLPFLLGKLKRLELQSRGDLAKVFKKIFVRKKEMEVLLNQLEMGEGLCRFQLTVGCWSDGDWTLDKQKVKNYLEQLGYTFCEDDYLHLEVFLNSLPGGTIRDGGYQDQLAKFHTVPTSTAAALLPIQSDWQGTPTPTLCFISRRGQIAFVDLFDNKAGNYNFAIIAGSGSGKSFFANEIIMSYLSQGAQVFVVDIGRSYERICENVGGQYIQMTEEDAINPFETDPLAEGEMDMLISLLGLMIRDDPLTTEESVIFERALMTLYAFRGLVPRHLATCHPEYVPRFVEKGLDGKEPRTLEFSENGGRRKGKTFFLTDVVNLLQDVDRAFPDLHPSLREKAKVFANALFQFTHSGQYGIFFCRNSTVSFKKDLVVIDLEHVAQRPALKKIIFFLIIQHISKAVYLGDRSRKKIVIVDEAWDLLKNAGNVARFIEGAYRKFRKYGGSIGCITQSAADFFFNETTKAALFNADWLFALRQKSESIPVMIENKIVPDDPFIERLLVSITTSRGEYSEVFVKYPGGWGIFRFVVDPRSYWMYTTAPDEVALIDKLKKQGMTTEEAIEHILKQKGLA